MYSEQSIHQCVLWLFFEPWRT